MTASSDSPRALIRYALVGLALTVFIAWALWEVRDALVLVYISALVAIGLSPYHDNEALITPEIQSAIDAALAGFVDGSVDPCAPVKCTVAGT